MYWYVDPSSGDLQVQARQTLLQAWVMLLNLHYPAAAPSHRFQTHQARPRAQSANSAPFVTRAFAAQGVGGSSCLVSPTISSGTCSKAGLSSTQLSQLTGSTVCRYPSATSLQVPGVIWPGFLSCQLPSPAITDWM